MGTGGERRRGGSGEERADLDDLIMRLWDRRGRGLVCTVGAGLSWCNAGVQREPVLELKREYSCTGCTVLYSTRYCRGGLELLSTPPK